MTPQMHAGLGLAVLVVNLLVGVWALMRFRAGQAPTRALSIGAGVGGFLLVLQLLVGADFWFRGARPAASPWAEIHFAGPVLALLQLAFFAIRRKTGAAQSRRWAIATLTTAAVALVSYGIGEMPSAGSAAAETARVPGTANRSAIDAIAVSPEVHVALGSAVLVLTLICAVWLGWLAVKGQNGGRLGATLLLLAQVALMGQAVIGIKLLSQGLGVLQIFIHYLGGLAPILFFMLTYWFPASNPRSQTRNQAIASVAAFVFVLMTFTIGRIYVRGSIV